MEAKHYARIRQAALNKARSKGFSSDGEDFAQEAATEIAQGRKANIAQLFIDFLRHTYGRNEGTQEQKTANAAKFAEQRSYIEVNQMANSLTCECAPSNEEFLDLLRAMDKRERADLILLFKWGFTLKEIGELHGVTEGAVSISINATLKRMQKRLKYPVLQDVARNAVT